MDAQQQQKGQVVSEYQRAVDLYQERLGLKFIKRTGTLWRPYRDCAVFTVRLTSTGHSQLVQTVSSIDGGLHVTFQRVLPTQPNAECSFVLKVNEVDVYEGTTAKPHGIECSEGPS